MAEDRKKSLPNITALAHYYRGEMSRSNNWRNIIDNTTNWAVGMTAAMLGFTFREGAGGNVVLLFAHILLFIFLAIEGRRYMYYISLDSRIRLLEKKLFGPMMRGDDEIEKGNWREVLATDLISRRIKISQPAAMSIRLRRTYIWLFLILTLAWLFKTSVYPVHASGFTGFLQNAGFSFVPGGVVVMALSAFYVLLIAGICYARRVRRTLAAHADLFPAGTSTDSF
jgi:uncharacterized membrane protein